MKKFLTPVLLLTMGSLAVASPVKLSNVQINESIKNTFGPDIKINYTKFKIDHSLDLQEKTGNINLDIYPETAVVKPVLFDSILKGKDTLDVANHKLITFRSNKVNFTEDNKVSSISGVLTVKNKSLPISFKATSVCQGEVGSRTCDVSLHAPLDRTKLGLNYGTSIGLSKQAPIDIKLKVKE
ncbi:MAG: YceI family protein [Neisseriaceae bacterium]|nr:YceI family protein [Neisseriaceae bacterium]